MNKTSLIYYTDNSLDPYIFQRCQEYLILAAQGKRIISVSQEPIDFGDNICVGKVGRSHHSLFSQALIGAKAADTKYVALVEHDIFYTPEHFDWIPPTDDLFYYNINHWFVQWGGPRSGMYTYHRRKVMSQLICNRELFIEAVEEKLRMLEYGATIKKGVAGACEPGVCDNREAFINLKEETYEMGKDVGKTPRNYRAKAFATELPNLDIRHGGNFSGRRIAKDARYSLLPWGSFHAVMGVPPPGPWYQEAVIDGKPVETIRNRDTNEKRWTKFIRPLVEGNNGWMTELGCNAGFYCRKFAELGFRATGVENDPMYLRQAHYWEARDQRWIRIVEEDITKKDPYCSHYILLANVHYWLTPAQLKVLAEKLRKKALNVIVVDRYKTAPVHKSPCGYEALLETFKDLTPVEKIEGGKHYSVLFRNQYLENINVAEIFPKQQLSRSQQFLPAYSALIRDVLDGTLKNPIETPYFQYLLKRRFPDPEKTILTHIDLVKITRDRGILEPVVIEGDRLVDGDHRLILARELGIKNIICQRR